MIEQHHVPAGLLSTLAMAKTHEYPPDSKPYFAHSANPAGHWHPLVEHLTAVANLSSAHACAAPWAVEAALAGLLHDLGKYGERFQGRLEGKDSGLDHWSRGLLCRNTVPLAPRWRSRAIMSACNGAIPLPCVVWR